MSDVYHSDDYYIQLARDGFPDIKRHKFKPQDNKYDSLEPLTSVVNLCTVCEKPILVAIFQNDGVCSVRCEKIKKEQDVVTTPEATSSG
jgi:hypothetical protein